ncbi:MAG: LEA type 2 family protein [Desulforegulaceae bacterium]|nr:LEA type 2 family protein [Desulforegulaceae bacterium]
MEKLTRVFIFLFLILVLNGCSMLKDAGLWKSPEVKVSSIEITSLDFEKIDIDVELEVLNDNIYSVSIGMLDYSLKINENELLSGKQNKSIVLEAQTSTKVIFPLSLNFKKLFSSAVEVKDKDSIAYVFEGGVSINLPGGGNPRIPFLSTGEIPIPRLPNLKVEGLKIEQINLFAASLKLGIKFVNPNNFSVNLKNYNYKFELNERQLAGGESGTGFIIEPKSEKLIEFPFNVSFANAGIAFYKMLTSSTDAGYAFNLEGEIKPGPDFFKAFPLKVEKEGKIELFK